LFSGSPFGVSAPARGNQLPTQRQSGAVDAGRRRRDLKTIPHTLGGRVAACYYRLAVSDHVDRRQDGKRDDVWAISRGTGGMVELILRTGPPRPLVATLSEAELASVADVLPTVADAVQRGEFSRIQLGAAFDSAIGRDPFRQMTAAPRSPGLFAWWLDLSYVVVGLGFAAGHHNRWLRLAGWVFAAVALADLVMHGWRRLRSRRPADTTR
jgi:hypothetical protein